MKLFGRRRPGQAERTRERERRQADAFYLHHLQRAAAHAATLKRDHIWSDLAAERDLDRWVRE